MNNIVYILKCSDGTLYTGSTVDMAKRLREHNGLKGGAKYTRGRRPVEVVYQEECETFAEVRAREAEIKRMSRGKKLLLIKTHAKE
jgi:putative endonuclease